jgi:hypothetical protein
MSYSLAGMHSQSAVSAILDELESHYDPVRNMAVPMNAVHAPNGVQPQNQSSAARPHQSLLSHMSMVLPTPRMADFK